MSFLDQLAEKVRRGDPLPFPVATVLSAATLIVRLGMWNRLRQPRVRVPARVISFGNITAGGTGKTPAVIERARTEMAAGHKVAVLTRGYGSPNPGELRIIEGGPSARDKVDQVGDEAALIAMKLPGAIVVRCRDRVAAAQAAIETHACDTLILDDGFQYVRLERDENICVIDATNPFGNGHLIPRGILREPLAALQRATHLILTRCDQCTDLKSTLDTLEKTCPGLPIRQTRHTPTGIWRVHDGSAYSLDEFRSKPSVAMCAIGNPEGFRKTLHDMNIKLTEFRTFPDHAQIRADDISRSGTVIVTEKDAIRMKAAPENVFALTIELREAEQAGNE